MGSSSGSSPSNKNSNSKTDTRFLSTGSELIDGGLLGVGAGLLGGAVLSGALNGGSNQGYNPCGRRKRQADDGTNTKFFNFGGSSGCNCGRRKRQAPGRT